MICRDIEDWSGEEDSRSSNDTACSVCTTYCLQYLVYALLGLCCTWCMLYQMKIVLGVGCPQC